MHKFKFSVPKSQQIHPVIISDSCTRYNSVRRRRHPLVCIAFQMPRKSKSAAAAASTAAEAEESQQSTQDLSQGMTTDEPADTQDSALDYDDSQTQEAEATEQGEDEEEAAKKTGGAGSKKEKHRAGKAKKKKADEEICTERDVLERIPLPAADERAGGGVKSFTVLAWNVNGLRATVKNGLDALRKMVDTEKPDLVCFQVPSKT